MGSASTHLLHFFQMTNKGDNEMSGSDVDTNLEMEGEVVSENVKGWEMNTKTTN